MNDQELAEIITQKIDALKSAKNYQLRLSYIVQNLPIDNKKPTSQLNCAATVPWAPGPLESWNLARMDPMQLCWLPLTSGSFHMAR